MLSRQLLGASHLARPVSYSYNVQDNDVHCSYGERCFMRGKRYRIGIDVGLNSVGLAAYRNFCGALDWFSLSVGGVGVSRGGVEFVPVDAGPVCGRDAVVRFGRRCLFALPQGVGDE